MSQTSHRKSFVKGILQVAAGEDTLPASELEEGKRLPHYVLRVEPYSWEDRYNRPLPDPDRYYRNEVSKQRKNIKNPSFFLKYVF